MKTYYSQNMLLVGIFLCVQFYGYAQMDQTAMNLKVNNYSESIVLNTNTSTPITLLDYCIADTNIFGSHIFDLGLDSNNYIIGIVNLCNEENCLNQNHENTFARTFTNNGTWFLEVQDLDATNTLSLRTHCVKLMVFNKNYTKKNLSVTKKIINGNKEVAFALPALY